MAEVDHKEMHTFFSIIQNKCIEYLLDVKKYYNKMNMLLIKLLNYLKASALAAC